VRIARSTALPLPHACAHTRPATAPEMLGGEPT
jgi:hypothetical protein